jgi:type IV pilus assembly protein PilP
MPTKYLALVLMLAGATLTAGCTGGNEDLTDYIAATKALPPKTRIDPLPQVQPYERFKYEVKAMREPFTPYSAASGGGNGGVRPDANRRREFLERYPLDTLSMVGTIERAGNSYGLIRDPEGLIHQVQVGEHMGQNDGRIVTVSQSEVALIEIVSDGMGGFLERPAAVALSE